MASYGRPGAEEGRHFLTGQQYHYDPQAGKYTASVLNFVRLGGVLIVAALGVFGLAMWRRERHKSWEKLSRPDAATPTKQPAAAQGSRQFPTTSTPPG